MQVIALLSQKGGAGKTTLALALAVAAQQSGRNTAVVDLDPQASAAKWGDRRGDRPPVVISAQAARLAQVLAAAENGGADLVILDTPPRADSVALAAAQAADLVLVPCRASVLDLETAATTAQLVQVAGDRKVAFVLNGVPWQGPKAAQAREVLTDAGFAVCPATIVYRVAHEHAATRGETAAEFDPDGKASAEVRHAYEWVCSLLDQSAR